MTRDEFLKKWLPDGSVVLDLALIQDLDASEREREYAELLAIVERPA